MPNFTPFILKTDLSPFFVSLKKKVLLLHSLTTSFWQQKKIFMKTQLAKFISTVGHPFITIPLFTVFATLNDECRETSALMPLLIVGGVWSAIAIKTLIGVKQGAYTNLDVSNQAQRQRWYVFVIVLLSLATGIAFWVHESPMLRFALLFGTFLLAIAQISNYYVKTSLHVSCHIFLSFLVMPLNFTGGIALLVFTPVLAWSRLVLKRHTLTEVLTGTILGFIMGAVFIYCFRVFG